MDSPEGRLPLVLIHLKSRRRFALRGDFVIGRSKGDLVFDQDPKLSDKHCLIHLTATGFALHDLKSRTGITVNGTPLAGSKACRLMPGTEFMVGDQAFSVEAEVLPAVVASNKRQRAHAIALASVSLLAVTVMGMALSFAPSTRANLQAPGAAPIAEMQSLDAQMKEAVTHYVALAEKIRLHAVTSHDCLRELREELIPMFTALNARLQNQPDPGGQLAHKRALAETYLGQATAMANYIQTKDAGYARDLLAYSRRLSSLQDDEAPTKQQRAPASQNQ